MPTILLLSEDSEAKRLKPDLESLEHGVLHLPLDLATPDSLNLTALDPAHIDLLAVDAGRVPQRMGPIVQRLRDHPSTKEAPIVLLVDEEALTDLDFSVIPGDFLVKPLRLAEVEARIRRLMWEAGLGNGDQAIKVKDLVINPSRYEVRVGGAPVEMTLKEYELLKHLVTHVGRVFTRADLLDSIWGYDYYGGMRTVDVHIRRLRSKLGTAGETITTVRGVGYSFTPP